MLIIFKCKFLTKLIGNYGLNSKKERLMAYEAIKNLNSKDRTIFEQIDKDIIRMNSKMKFIRSDLFGKVQIRNILLAIANFNKEVGKILNRIHTRHEPFSSSAHLSCRRG